MANHLKMAQHETVVALFKQGWSKRKISRQLGIDRRTVCRHIRNSQNSQNQTSAAEALQEISKCTTPPDQVTTGNLPAAAEPKSPSQNEVTAGSAIQSEPLATGSIQVSSQSKSLCEPYRPLIEQKVEAGLSAQRIYQDLIAEHGFNGGYESVKRMVRKFGVDTHLPFRRMECEPGAEAQADFGSGGPVGSAEGERRRTHVLRLILSFSRKGYSEAFFRQTTDNLLACWENAFWSWGGVPKTLVIDNLKAAVLQAD